MNQRPKHKTQNYKIMSWKKTEEELHVTGFDSDFLDVMLKAQATKLKDKLDNIKI